MRQDDFHIPTTAFVTFDWHGMPLRLEYQWVGARNARQPVVVFLHEGLGSVSMWRDFPAKFCCAHGLTGLVFSRYGYGKSSPRPAEERWPVDFMQTQAVEVLPQLFAALDIHRPWLFGHSDGGSIALLYAASNPDSVTGLIVVAPHIFVEPLSIRSIEQARAAYQTGELRSKLQRHHDDPDSAFWGWNAVWLDPAFCDWNIEDQLTKISCPILAVQGENDEYGTLEQIRGIQRKAPQTRLLILPQCGHSPHRDQPETLIKEAAQFIRRPA